MPDPSPKQFKGIALFTPGGDVIYCIDSNKQSRWHLQLCIALQQILGLSEPPHFLVPCYTATVDRWIDPITQQLQTIAETAPPILRYQPFLNALFGTETLIWQPASIQEGVCDPVVLATHRQQFPELWEPHDLIVPYEQAEIYLRSRSPQSSALDAPSSSQSATQGYVLRLFVSGNTITTERTLQNLHHLLEQFLNQPYTLKVIDVLQDPDQAERDLVAATPTLVKAWPPPVRRIVGNLDNANQLLHILNASSDWKEAPG